MYCTQQSIQSTIRFSILMSFPSMYWSQMNGTEECNGCVRGYSSAEDAMEAQEAQRGADEYKRECRGHNGPHRPFTKGHIRHQNKSIKQGAGVGAIEGYIWAGGQMGMQMDARGSQHTHKKIEDIKSFLWGHWYPCCGLLVISPLGFKSRVGSLIQVLLEAYMFTSGATLPNLLMASMAAKPISSMYL